MRSPSFNWIKVYDGDWPHKSPSKTQDIKERKCVGSEGDAPFGTSVRSHYRIKEAHLQL